MKLVLDDTGAPTCGDCGGPAPERHGGYRLGPGQGGATFFWHQCSVCGAKTGLIYAQEHRPGPRIRL